MMTLKNYNQYFSKALESRYPETEIQTFFFYLMEAYLGFERIQITLQPDFEIPESTLDHFNCALNRLKNEEPIQYILGTTEFYGLPFKVNKHVLIPRPETEELVAWILSDLQSFSTPLTVLDIGTGTGCIPITLKKNKPILNLHAIDISEDALNIARHNAQRNKVEINFIKQDILQTEKLNGTLDIIISNPPYVRDLEKKEIKNNVLKNEPHLALFVSDSDPLIFYSKIADLALNNLSQDGLLYFEINQYLGKETVQLLHEKGFKNVTLKTDMFGNHRMIKASL